MSDLIPKNNLQIVLKNDISNQNKVKPKKVLDEETYVKVINVFLPIKQPNLYLLDFNFGLGFRINN